ncbi:hypothetical protein [Glycomyces paridis]|uniref:Uncharacterized protein n=1 Tax=Glycomyces paridis TaxID=2126555 RepID=A0A4S8PLD0_9ACTN|nr:hypothetical protein [Glycomyces paridis]THV31560.1 hypothetical protein E9998_04155 [Glycomyces paridis]
MSSLRGAGAFGAAAVLALTSGCGMLGIGAEEEASDEDRLIEMLNENSRISGELADAEFRIVQGCLEEQGFTVHDPWTAIGYESYEVESLAEYLPNEEFILDPEEAAEYGFGQWSNSPDGAEDPASEEYWTAQEEKWSEEEDEMGWEEPDTSEWDALTPDEQYDWYVAYQGEEYAEYANGTREDYNSMFSEEGMVEYSEEDLTEEELAEGEDGEIDIEGGYEDIQPKPAGCQLEMIEALYGESALKEEKEEEVGGEEGETYTYSYWTYRPENPMDSGDSTMYEDIEADIAQGMSDVQYEFLDCIEAKGHTGWEFTEWGSLPTWEFFASLYYQDASDEEREMWLGDSETELPEIPEAAGTTYEDWKAYEIQVAVDFAACGEETDYAAQEEKINTDVYVEVYSAFEGDVYAWQDEMRESLEKAQGLLGS